MANPIPASIVEDWSDMINLPTKNGGSTDGLGRFIDSLPSMRTTNDMVGLSLGSSWTHNNAIWINLWASLISYKTIVD